MLKDRYGRPINVPTCSAGEASRRKFEARAVLDKAYETGDKEAIERARQAFTRATMVAVR